MVVVIYGFPYKKLAMYFEWCWQHPYEAKLIKDVMANVKQIGKRGYLKANIRYCEIFGLICLLGLILF